MSDFYPAFSSTCFVVLTLWLMTVQQRRDEWRKDPKMTKRAFGIGLYFSLPGIMTLISLVDPASPRLWEWSYTVVALGGAIVMVALYSSGRDRLTTFAYPVAIVLYLAIGALAIAGLTRQQAAMENHVDQVLLAVMLFLGVNVAWWLVFAGLPDDDGDGDGNKGGEKGGDRVRAAGNQAAATD